jgi:hypothetical protein
MRIRISRDISKVSEVPVLSSKPVPYLPYLDEDQRSQVWLYKIKRKLSVWKKECETTRKRDEVSKIDMHETPYDISSGLTENIIITQMHVRTTSTVILTCYNSIIKQ